MEKDQRTIYYKLRHKAEKFNTIPLKRIEEDLKKEKNFCDMIIGEIFKYGENLLFRMMDDCTEGICRDSIIIMLQRDILEFIDAIAILIKNTAHSSAKLFLRNIFERMLMVTYILKTEEFEIQEKRACEYMLLNLHERRKFLMDLNDYDQIKLVDAQIEEILNYKDDSVDEYKLYNKNYIISISKLVDEVDCSDLYSKHYAPMSNLLHGKRVLDHANFTETESLLSELHCPFNSIQFLYECCELILPIYDLFESRLFENYKEYQKWEKNIKSKVKIAEEQSIKMFNEKEAKKMDNINKEKYICITNN